MNQARKPATCPPKVIAHRGFSAAYPENTAIAFEAALAQPIFGIELDLQLTRDGVVVVFHDRTLQKAGAPAARIDRQSYQRLRTKDFGAWFGPAFMNTGLLSLDELLTRFGTRCRLLLELKVWPSTTLDQTQALMLATIDAVRNHGLADRAYLLCFDFDLLRWGWGKAPDLAYVWNLRHPDFREQDSFLAAYSIKVQNLTAAFALQARERGKPVWVFTVNKRSHLNHALACGVNGVMSDDPAWLIAELAGAADPKSTSQGTEPTENQVEIHGEHEGAGHGLGLGT